MYSVRFKFTEPSPFTWSVNLIPLELVILLLTRRNYILLIGDFSSHLFRRSSSSSHVLFADIILWFMRNICRAAQFLFP